MALTKSETVELIYTIDKFRDNEEFETHFPNVDKKLVNTLIVDDAYYMINSLEGNKDGVSFVLIVYKDETKDFVLKVEKHTFTPDLSSDTTPNFYVQAYTYLKTLPNFVDAIDC